MDFITLETIMARDEKSISSRALYLLQQPLVEQLIALRDNNSDGDVGGNLTISSVEIDETHKAVRVTSACSDENNCIKAYGNLMLTALGHSNYGNRSLMSIAHRCSMGEIETLEQVHLLLERMVSRSIYKMILTIIAIGLAIMALVRYL